MEDVSGGGDIVDETEVASCSKSSETPLGEGESLTEGKYEMAERAKSSRRFAKEGSIVSVSSSLFPEENCDRERVYGVFDKSLPNGFCRIKWKDGYTSLIEEGHIRFENDIKDLSEVSIDIPDNDRVNVAVENDINDQSEVTIDIPDNDRVNGSLDDTEVDHTGVAAGSEKPLDDEGEKAEQGSGKEGEMKDVSGGGDMVDETEVASCSKSSEDPLGEGESLTEGDEVFLLHKKKRIMKAILIGGEGEVHFRRMEDNERKFEIKKIYKNISVWNKYEYDIHCEGSYIIWNMDNVIAADVIKNDKDYYRNEVSKVGTKIEVRESRKRRKTESLWNQKVQKRKRNCGEEYVITSRTSKVQKVIPARKMGGPCECKMLNCDNKYTQEMREKIFEHYWNLGDINLQRMFLCKCAKQRPKKRTRIRNVDKAKTNERMFSVEYSLPSEGDDEDVRVCAVFLVNTLGISRKALASTIKMTDNETGIVRTDQRGQNVKRKKDNLDVKRHIKKFKAIESHYVRKQVWKKFLPAELNVKKMYRMYKEWCKTKKLQPETYDVYYKVFKRDFNLSFQKPKKDQCSTCESFKLGDKTPEDEKKHKKHLKDKDLARGIKKEAKEKARVDKKICVGAFDLEKVLLCPHGEIDLFYYKRRLKQHNFTVTDLVTKDVFCYFWSEEQGNKGANEVSTGTHNFLEFQAGQGKTNIHLFSDNCPGQQGNRYYFLSLSYAVRKFGFDVVTHTFLVKGHTQTINDTAHSLIERK